MESLIFLMNKLQDTFQLVGSSADVTLPRIAVVGGQSAGKSSVLENFVGKTFLPSGSGIVTRRPLVLQLVYSENQEYGEFTHKPGVRFEKLVGINQEITRETDRLCPQQNVSPEPINLKIYSPNVVNLTLVDLPGLTRVATIGQDQSVVATIRKMVTDYVTDENCLILAVTPATMDPATSDAIALAKEIDPSGDRTIGVITKLDTNITSYAEIVRTLENKSVHLKRGYVGVINRSPDELKVFMDRDSVEKKEKEKLERFPAYRPVANKCGVVHLQNYLQQQLVEHISKQLPILKTNIESQLRSLELQLEGMDTVLDTSDGQVAALTKILKIFIDNVEADLGFQKEIVKEFSGATYGSKIKEAIFIDFRNKLRTSSKMFKGNLKQIVLNIKSTSGIFAESGFSTPAFNKCVRDCLKKNRLVIDEMSTHVKNLLLELIKKEAGESITFENLKREVIAACNSMIEEQFKKTTYHLNFILDSQECYIDRMNPEFQRISNSKSQNEKEAQKIAAPAYHANQQMLENDCIHSGEVAYMKKGKIGLSKKSYIGKLKKDRLELVVPGKDNKFDVRYTFLLGMASYKLIAEKFTIVLETPPDLPVELSLASDEQLTSWTKAFETVGVNEKQIEKSKSNHKNSAGGSEDNSGEDEPEIVEERPSDCPPYMWKTAIDIRSSVVDYVDVVGKVLHDISSKIVFNGLPILLRYNMGTRLSANLLKVLEEKELMKQNEFDVEKLKTLKTNKNALKSALEIINNPQSAIAEYQKAQTHRPSTSAACRSNSEHAYDTNSSARHDDYGYDNSPNKLGPRVGDFSQFTNLDAASPNMRFSNTGSGGANRPRAPSSRPLPAGGPRMPMPRGVPPSQPRPSAPPS